ncbi:MAG: phosphate regulon sensor histidine kinase PhoR [Pseudomonadota bacterium]
MFEFWWRTWLPVGGLLLVALLVWPLWGALPAAVIFSLLLLAWMAYNVRQFIALSQWLQVAETAPVPEGRGLWEDLFSHLNQYVRAQRKRQQQMEEELLHMQQATSALPEGVVILDEADRIEWCNPLAQQHFGLDPKHDIGQQIAYLARQPEFVHYLAMRQFDEPLVLRGLRQDGLVLSIKLIRYGDNKRLMISQDITHLERIETMRRDFVANVSHELRTPLTVVSGFVETLADLPSLDQERGMAQRALGMMGEQTLRMTRLVDDLLTLSKLENAHNQPQEDDVDVPALLHALLREGETLSNGKHKLRLDLQSRDGLHGSKDELRSAFGNLVSNAIRYTPDGGNITLCWQVREGQPVFSVQDSGIGIAPQHIPRLTERFYRVDRSRSRETGGTGLGLAIVKHIANRHQAQLEIVSEEGQGSTFSLVFPEQRRVAAK